MDTRFRGYDSYRNICRLFLIKHFAADFKLIPINFRIAHEVNCKI